MLLFYEIFEKNYIKATNLRLPGTEVLSVEVVNLSGCVFVYIRTYSLTP